jgi:hypothetical protein
MDGLSAQFVRRRAIEKASAHSDCYVFQKASLSGEELELS